MSTPHQATAAAPESGSPAHFDMPAGACDCHIHVIPDASEFPFTLERSYTPGPACLDDLQAMHRRLGIERFVIVTPSVYGADNAVTMKVLAQACLNVARGVAVIDENTTDAEMASMSRQGVCGVRINMEVRGDDDPAEFIKRARATALRIQPLGWHLQANIKLSVIASLTDQLTDLPVMLVVDHFAHARGAAGIHQPGFSSLLKMLRTGKAYVKLSAPYLGGTPPGYADMVPLAQACLDANPERVLWGSNWPHPDTRQLAGHSPFDVSPYQKIDDAAMFGLLANRVFQGTSRKQVLVDNPARLYGF